MTTYDVDEEDDFEARREVRATALLDLAEETETAAADVAGKSDLQRDIAEALEREYGSGILGRITLVDVDSHDVARVVLRAIAADLRRR